MLKRYKNAFLTAIHEAGLDLSIFELEEAAKAEPDPIYPIDKVGQPILIIKLKNSPIKFLV